MVFGIANGSDGHIDEAAVVLGARAGRSDLKTAGICTI